ncbi:F0F1 ATP synthase subunit A [Ketogulonicigenium vulgare]|uniref:ATP synthase subunit a n=1 Tax=Ketogulonicigenium vulgare (strain WSH-001) TaxID=759362 RepID=F9Y7H8_KETVW|nr:F0F1 ATP synthase subunit A [Ketogulonicigenium vulgare]ADO41284.1 ATP synthase F0, A subunit [Ketogulonicigenium vulgare Y25]AEM42274.1 ATP synthase subunit a [Ketogulonicigenium vulgare WSH-001]ALJ79894.1 ATP synthase F0F1 subunit A [Ketogulonicigenium vulgare]AOZ53110.1 ATP synthase F0, A subunit [Ketogulonicigenium vulgare]
MAESTETGFVFHPLDQFQVKSLFGGDIGTLTLTNASLWIMLAVVCVWLLMVVGARKRELIPGRMQSVAEMTYGFIHKMVEDVAGHDGVKYFPLVMTLFLFVLFANALALIPMSFSPTSHIAVTVVLALIVFVFVTGLGFVKHGAGFLGLFWIKSAPLAIRPVLAVIEVISYFVRPVSHSIRLAGNLLAGHAVIKVFAAFAASLLIAPVSIIAISGMFAFEVMVAVIQAYVFTILTCVYLKDALHPAH